MSIFDGIDPFDEGTPFTQETRGNHNEALENSRRWRELHESVEAVLLEVAEIAEAPPAARGVTLGQVTVFSDPFNATYTIVPLPSAIVDLPDGEELTGVIPQGRMFDTQFVDFHNAAVGSPATIHPLPLETGYAGPWYLSPMGQFGGCLALTGDCEPKSSLVCEGEGGLFLGVNSPCALVYLTEFVKISTCPDPPLLEGGPLPPPPVVTQIAGLLA